MIGKRMGSLLLGLVPESASSSTSMTASLRGRLTGGILASLGEVLLASLGSVD